MHQHASEKLYRVKDRAFEAITRRLRIALAPCSPFTVDADLMRQTAALARQHGVRLHTHLAETRDEEEYCRKRFRQRPLDFFRDCGWLHEDAWVAHGIYFNAGECGRLGRAGVGVAHCPTSNMRLASGICPVEKLQRAGSPVGLGVDGSASNDSSNMLAEARQALLLNRLARGASAITVHSALRMATLEGARCLGRDDIGSIAVGKVADLVVIDGKPAERISDVRRTVQVVRLALEQSSTRLEDLAAIAVTQGPGLVGSLLVGITYAKALAFFAARPELAAFARPGKFRWSYQKPYEQLIVGDGKARHEREPDAVPRAVLRRLAGRGGAWADSQHAELGAAGRHL